MNEDEVYYLSSLESVRFEPVRECRIIKRLEFDTGKQCALVKVTPSVVGQPWGLTTDIENFVLANRHEDEELFPITEFPCFVHIARILTGAVDSSSVISASDLQTVAWGELYRTRSDAENHVFENTNTGD